MIVDQAEKELHLQLWKESGLSKAAYAVLNGINRNTFYGWVNRNETKSSQLVEIQHFASTERDQPSTTPIELHLPNGYRVSIQPRFNHESLSLLLDVLEDRRCS